MVVNAILLLTVVLITLGAPQVLAAPGLDIAWFGATDASKCPVNIGAMMVVTDPCDSNGRVHGFSLAFKAPAGISKLVGEQFTLDVQTASNVLPPWWDFQDRNDGLGLLPGCRGGDPLMGLTSSFSFSTSRGTASTVTCKDYWQGAQSGTVFWYPSRHGPEGMRLCGSFASDSASAGPLTANVEYFVGTGSFDTNHAVADPLATPPVETCNGCQIPACAVFTSLLLQQPAGTPGGDVLISNDNQRRAIAWQDGIPFCYPTPVKRSTWGQVKSLYR